MPKQPAHGKQLAKTRKSKGRHKRQNKKKQSEVRNQKSVKTKKKPKQPTHTLSTFILPKTRLTHFRELKGKIIEDVLFSAAPDHQDITIKLQDKTGLSFSIATGLIMKTEYSDWTSGEQRILRSWVLKSKTYH